MKIPVKLCCCRTPKWSKARAEKIQEVIRIHNETYRRIRQGLLVNLQSAVKRSKNSPLKGSWCFEEKSCKRHGSVKKEKWSEKRQGAKNSGFWGAFPIYNMSSRQFFIESDQDIRFYVVQDPNNRWFHIARNVPWDYIDNEYCEQICANNGRPAVPARQTFAVRRKHGLRPHPGVRRRAGPPPGAPEDPDRPLGRSALRIPGSGSGSPGSKTGGPGRPRHGHPRPSDHVRERRGPGRKQETVREHVRQPDSERGAGPHRPGPSHADAESDPPGLKTEQGIGRSPMEGVRFSSPAIKTKKPGDLLYARAGEAWSGIRARQGRAQPRRNPAFSPGFPPLRRGFVRMHNQIPGLRRKIRRLFARKAPPPENGLRFIYIRGSLRRTAVYRPVLYIGRTLTWLTGKSMTFRPGTGTKTGK